MTRDDHISASDAGTTWRSSSYSGGQGNCVQVASDRLGVVPVRDSKAAPDGPVIGFSRGAWNAFLAHLS